MKIHETVKKEFTCYLRALNAGDVFRFYKAPPQKHDPSDPFVVVDTSSYDAREYLCSKRPEQIAVVNLRTGALGYFVSNRDVVPLKKATLVLEGV